PPDGSVTITEYHPLRFYAYPDMRADVERAVCDLAEVVVTYGIPKTMAAPAAEEGTIVIEVGACDVVAKDDGAHAIVPLSSYLCGGGTITAETRAIHHISPAEILGFLPFDAQAFVAQAREDGVAAIAAHHADFEGKWVGSALDGLPLICTYKGALRVWPDAPSHQNQVLRYWLEEQGLSAPDPILCQPARRAGPDAYATAHLLKALLAFATPAALVEWTTEPAALPRCTIGK